jgi:hypothetical protein
MTQFMKDAIEAGFTKEQAEFMEEFLAKFPHTHSMDEVDGLDKVLDELENEDEEDEDGDEE